MSSFNSSTLIPQSRSFVSSSRFLQENNYTSITGGRRHTMKPRVAVCETPHRFEVVPLRPLPPILKDVSSHPNACTELDTPSQKLGDVVTHPTPPENAIDIESSSSLSAMSYAKRIEDLLSTPTRSLNITPRKKRSPIPKLFTPAPASPPRNVQHNHARSEDISGRRRSSSNPKPHWRRAIYTQSLYVPSFAFLSEPPPAPFKSRKPTHSYVQAPNNVVAYDACELESPVIPQFSFPRPAPPPPSLGLRSSLRKSSPLPRDRARSPSKSVSFVRGELDCGYAIVSDLLEAVDSAMLEWRGPAF